VAVCVAEDRAALALGAEVGPEKVLPSPLGFRAKCGSRASEPSLPVLSVLSGLARCEAESTCPGQLEHAGVG